MQNASHIRDTDGLEGVPLPWYGFLEKMTIELSPKKCEMSSKRRGRENCLADVSAVFFHRGK